MLYEHIEIFTSLHLLSPWGNRERKQGHTLTPKKKPSLSPYVSYTDHVLLCRILDGNQPTITPLPHEAPLREKVVLTYNFVRPVSRCYVVSVRKKINSQNLALYVCTRTIYKYKTQVEVLVDSNPIPFSLSSRLHALATYPIDLYLVTVRIV